MATTTCAFMLRTFPLWRQAPSRLVTYCSRGRFVALMPATSHGYARWLSLARSRAMLSLLLLRPDGSKLASYMETTGLQTARCRQEISSWNFWAELFEPQPRCSTSTRLRQCTCGLPFMASHYRLRKRLC